MVELCFGTTALFVRSWSYILLWFIAGTCVWSWWWCSDQSSSHISHHHQSLTSSFSLHCHFFTALWRVEEKACLLKRAFVQIGQIFCFTVPRNLFTSVRFRSSNEWNSVEFLSGPRFMHLRRGSSLLTSYPPICLPSWELDPSWNRARWKRQGYLHGTSPKGWQVFNFCEFSSAYFTVYLWQFNFVTTRVSDFIYTVKMTVIVTVTGQTRRPT